LNDSVAERVRSSFRDPSGYVIHRDGQFYRIVDEAYSESFEALIDSGLHASLIERGLALQFEVINSEWTLRSGAWKVLHPRQIDLVSYPYEWCFGQLKDAALATLAIQKLAIKHGLTLKDATAFNIQFVDGKPVHIDSLSYEKRGNGDAWIAYRQFCQHFVAPLALMSYRDTRLSNLTKSYLDGIPLDLAVKLLPTRARLNPGLAVHLFIHSKANRSGARIPSRRAVSKTAALALVESLRRMIDRLPVPESPTEWSNYVNDTNYSDRARTSKERIVSAFLGMIPEDAMSCWDFGGNSGDYSRVSTERGLRTTIWDVDHGAVSLAYERLRSGLSSSLPLIIDLTNPSPNLGWMHAERQSMLDRGPVDVCLALALIHHLTIGNNVPLGEVATFFSKVANWVILEFVPFEDSQVQRMMVARKNVFGNYNLQAFEGQFSKLFEIVRKEPVEDSTRVIFLLRRKK